MDKKRLYRNIVILAVVLAFVLFIVLVLQLITLANTNARNKELIKEVENLQREIDGLEDEIEYKKSLMYIEKYARENLDLYGEDDVVFVPQG